MKNLHPEIYFISDLCPPKAILLKVKDRSLPYVDYTFECFEKAVECLAEQILEDSKFYKVDAVGNPEQKARASLVEFSQLEILQAAENGERWPLELGFVEKHQ